MTRFALNARTWFIVGFVICAGLLGYAYYLQYVELENPCPLCMVQRVAFYGVAAVFLLGALHGPNGPKRRGIVVYGVLAFIVAALGAAVAARHVWLQNLPAHLVPSCGPGLEYMLKKFPLADVFSKVLMGSGECAEAGWKFLGLTIAGWSLLWLVLLAILALVITLRGNVRR